MASPTIVVGGGAIGSSIAWRVAELGSKVILIDPTPGEGASDVAAGMLAPVTEVHYGEEDLLALNLASSRMYANWIDKLRAASGLDPGYQTHGTLVVARDADDNTALDDLYRFQLELGLDVQRLTSRACKDVEPGLSPNIRGGILVEGDHQIDPAALVRSLLEAARRTGVEVVRAEVTEVVIESGRVTGVRTADGRDRSASKVIIAAGASSGRIAGLPNDLFPVRPVKGQLLHLETRGEPCPIARNVRGLDVYLVPRAGGRVVVGATMEEMSWDDSITAAAVHDLLRHAYELVPAITEMRFVGARAGFRPGTPDNAPLLGLTEIEGLIAATGHFRNGILLTPITAEAIARLVVNDEVRDEIAPFTPERFTRSGAGR